MNDLDKKVKEKWARNLVVINEIISSGDGADYDCYRIEEMETGPSDCPYCEEYRIDSNDQTFSCGVCPIYIKTGYDRCTKTPARLIENDFSLIDSDIYDYDDTGYALECLKASVEMMIVFLETVYEKD